MPDPVFHVAHLAPYRFRARRGRNARLAMAPVDTTVRVETLSRAEMPWVGRDGRYRILAHREGALWTTVPTWRNRADGLPDLALLGNEPPPRQVLPDSIHHLFCRTPFQPWLDDRFRMDAMPAPGAAAEVLADGRDLASAALAAYVRDHVRAVEGDLYVRTPGPLAVLDPDTDGLTLTTRYGRLHAAVGSYAAPRRADALWSLLSNGPTPRLRPLEGNVPDVENDDDVLAHVNCEPAVVWHLAAQAMADIRRAGLAPHAGLEEAMAGTLWLVDAAMTGSVGTGEAPDALKALSGLSAAIRDAMLAAGLEPYERFGRADAFARDVIWPAVAPPASAADEEAMAGIAP